MWNTSIIYYNVYTVLYFSSFLMKIDEDNEEMTVTV